MDSLDHFRHKIQAFLNLGRDRLHRFSAILLADPVGSQVLGNVKRMQQRLDVFKPSVIKGVYQRQHR